MYFQQTDVQNQLLNPALHMHVQGNYHAVTLAPSVSCKEVSLHYKNKIAIFSKLLGCNQCNCMIIILHMHVQSRVKQLVLSLCLLKVRYMGLNDC